MSERELGKKWDRCLADGAIKIVMYPLLKNDAPYIWHRDIGYWRGGTGLGLGIVLSVLFFKRHTWPISFGSGAGLGMAYGNCQSDLRSSYLLHRSEKEQ